MLGVDITVEGRQEKSLDKITLGNGDGMAMLKLFRGEGHASSWQQFQPSKLPARTVRRPLTHSEAKTPKRKKKEDEILVFDPNKKLDMADLLKQTQKPAARKKVSRLVTQEEFSQLLIERNYHFRLSRLAKLSLKPMPVKLNTKKPKEKLPEQTNDGTGIAIDTQLGNEENDHVADGPEVLAEQANVHEEIKAAKEPEIEFKLDSFPKVINAKQLKENLWKQIEQSKPISSKSDSEEDKENEVLYKTDFSTVYSAVQSNQSCSPQACFVCMLHLANEKGLTLTQNEGELSDFRILKKRQAA